MPSHKQELICINVDKVYDWIVKDMSFEINPTTPFVFTGLQNGTDLNDATITCRVVPSENNPIVIMDREDRLFTIDGAKVCLQQLMIKKNFTLTLFLKINGSVYSSQDIDVSRCEQVIMCAPKGTDVEVTYTDLDCFVCSTGELTYEDINGSTVVTFGNLSISVNVCQSIQSTFPVTVEFVADYCEPRAELPFACPPASRPNPCPVIYP